MSEMSEKSEPSWPTVSIKEALAYEPDLPHPAMRREGEAKSFPLVVRKEVETDYRHSTPRTEERFVTKAELRFRIIKDDNGHHHWRVVNPVYL